MEDQAEVLVVTIKAPDVADKVLEFSGGTEIALVKAAIERLKVYTTHLEGKENE